MSTPKILVVDDEKDLAELLADELRDQGYDASYVTNGQTAIDLLDSESIDLLLSDIRMPGIGGLELLKKVVDGDLKCPVIMISAFADVTPERVQELGAYALLSKPLNWDLLEQTVRDALASR